jgi:hypothetical protein
MPIFRPSLAANPTRDPASGVDVGYHKSTKYDELGNES